jgi:broad specificity phosphatase PhoE
VTVLEVRRHSSTRKGPGSSLSQEGVTLARRVGAGLGPFDLVVVSDIPRTLETALAMGFAVDAIDPALTAHDEAIHRQVEARGLGKRLAFAEWARLAAEPGPVAAHARLQRERWLAVAARLPASGSALVLSHGGTIEPGVVVSLPDAIWAEWGPLQHLDGVRMVVHDGRFTAGELLRA